MYKLLIIFSSIILLCACTGISKQDLKQLGSITSLNNQVTIKRQRQFVISPASSIGLMITGSPTRHKHILDSFKYHVRHAELVYDNDELANRYDFVFKIVLLKMEMKNKVAETETKAIAINTKDPIKDASSSKKKKSSSFLKPIKIKPLQLVMNISLVDAVNGQVIDVALIDAYSSTLRPPKDNDFISDAVNRYMGTLTSI